MKPTNNSTENSSANSTENSTANSSAKILVVGSLNMDYVLQTRRLPLKGETLPAKDFQMVHGGKGMNQSVAIKRFGGNPIMIGCLGKDTDGDDLLEGLEKESISSVSIYRSEKINTGIAFITVSDDGDNTIVVHPGSNLDLPVDWVLGAIKEHQDAKMLVLQMEIPLEVIKSTINQAYDYGIPVVLNPSPFKELPKAILEKVHTLVVNEVEAEQVAKTMGYTVTNTMEDINALSDQEKSKTWQEGMTAGDGEEDAKQSEPSGADDSLQKTKDPEALVELLAKSKIPRIILTKGDQGVYYNDLKNSAGNKNATCKDGEGTCDEIKDEERPADAIIVRHQAAKSVQVVDPTAAGDSFLGAYVAGRCRGYSLDKAIAYGILAGALAVTKAGAQPSIPSAADLTAAGWP